MLCPKCGRPMKWDAYVTARRPDALTRRNDRAPISYAWHCRCGMWYYAAGRNASRHTSPGT